MSPTRAAFVVFIPVMTYPTCPVHRRPVDTGSGARTPICSRAAVLSACYGDISGSGKTYGSAQRLSMQMKLYMAPSRVLHAAAGHAQQHVQRSSGS